MARWRLLAVVVVALAAWGCSGDSGRDPGTAGDASPVASAPVADASPVPASVVPAAGLQTPPDGAPPQAMGSYLLDTSAGVLYSLSPLLDGSWSPDGGVIAFVRCCSGDGFIDLLDVRSGVSRRVATGDVRDPAWSPDGSKLAFVPINDFQSGTGVRVMERDGSRVRAVVSHMGAGDPRWLDDDRIAYTVGVPNVDEPSFFLARLSDAGRQRQLQRGEPPGDLDPRVVFGSASADGAYVVYFDGPYRRGEGRSVVWERASRSVRPLAPRLVLTEWASATHTALVLSIGPGDGAALAEVVDFDSGDSRAVGGGFESRWSADGRTVLHLGYQCRDGVAFGETDLFATVPGSARQNLSRTPGEVEYEVVPAPSGDAVAFAARVEGGSPAWRLSVRGTAGAGSLSLAFSVPVHVRDGAWSADGRYLLFTLGAGGEGGCR